MAAKKTKNSPVPGQKNTPEREIVEKISGLSVKRDCPVYLVGGYLRDRILRRVSHDLDFVVEGDATGFARLVSRELRTPPPVVYRRFGTAMLRKGKMTLEFASARRESYAPHSRKPSVVPATVEEDLRRRDFTINALAFSLRDGREIDLFGGRCDIREKIIRTPVDPDRTFYDDPLRMLRAVRFAARFNFRIAPDTADSIRRNRRRLEIVSRERIAGEFLGMMEAAAPSRAILGLDELGILSRVLPEVSDLKKVTAANDRDCKDVFRHTMIVLDRVSARTRDRATRLAALFHDIGKPATQRFVPGEGWTFHDHPLVGARLFANRAAPRLGIGSPEKEKIFRLIEMHLRPHYLAGEGVADEGATNRAIAHLARDAGADLKHLFVLARADLTSRNERKVERGRRGVDELERKVAAWKKSQRAAVFRLAVDGHEIMEVAGIPPGPGVGKIKGEMEKLVLDGELPNRKRELKKYLRQKAISGES